MGGRGRVCGWKERGCVGGRSVCVCVCVVKVPQRTVPLNTQICLITKLKVGGHSGFSNRNLVKKEEYKQVYAHHNTKIVPLR